MQGDAGTQSHSNNTGVTMTMSEELKRLQDLHRAGTLNDEEFAKAKSAVIGTQPGSTDPARKPRVTWAAIGSTAGISLILVLVSLFFAPGLWRPGLTSVGFLFLSLALAAGISQITRVSDRVVWLLLVLGAALVSNPGMSSFEDVWREQLANGTQKANALEKLAFHALVDVSFERKNYYLFSVVTITSRVRLVGPQAKVEILGAFGHWWFELLDTPLYQVKQGKQGDL